MFLFGYHHVGNGYYSPDGKNWQIVPGAPGRQLTYFQNRWFCTEGAAIYVSHNNGRTWQNAVGSGDPFGPTPQLPLTKTYTHLYASWRADYSSGLDTWARTADGINWEILGEVPEIRNFGQAGNAWVLVEYESPWYMLKIFNDPLGEPIISEITDQFHVFNSTGRRVYANAFGTWLVAAAPGGMNIVSVTWPTEISEPLVENDYFIVSREQYAMDARFLSGWTTFDMDRLGAFGNKLFGLKNGSIYFTRDGNDWEGPHSAPGSVFLAENGVPLLSSSNLSGQIVSVDGKTWTPLPAGGVLTLGAWSGVMPDIVGGGFWPYRQRQSLGASGYPYRQRQNGGNTGSYPYRQRQRGL